MTTSGSGPWWESHTEVARLIRWLGESGSVDDYDASDWAYLVEKPWKWDSEYQEMLKMSAEATP